MTGSAAAAEAAEAGSMEAARRRIVAGIREEIIRLAKYKHMRGGDAVVKSIRQAQRGEAHPKTVLHMVGRELMTWKEGEGPPKLTVLGRSVIMASDLGIRFLDACILAVVYRYARALHAGTAHRRSGGSGGGASGRCITIPLRTIQNYLIDWPCSELMIRKSLSRLRSVGLLPRSSRRRIICDLQHLSGVHDVLVELDKWVEETSEKMRYVLITPVQRSGMRRPGQDEA